MCLNELPLSFYKFTHLVKVILLFIRRFIRFRYKREQLLFELIPLYERERERTGERGVGGGEGGRPKYGGVKKSKGSVVTWKATSTVSLRRWGFEGSEEVRLFFSFFCCCCQFFWFEISCPTFRRIHFKRLTLSSYELANQLKVLFGIDCCSLTKRCRDSNPGRQGVKRESYLRAVPSPPNCCKLWLGNFGVDIFFWNFKFLKKRSRIIRGENH